MVRLEGYERRKPNELSGGQRRRRTRACARGEPTARAPARRTAAPPSEALREEMQIELKQIQQEVGITFIYVTHDQGEVLTMSDRLAVFNEGRIEQLGAPAEVYERPTTSFVAGFVGTSNLLTGDTARQVLGRTGAFTIRPEKIHLAEPDTTVRDDEVRERSHPSGLLSRPGHPVLGRTRCGVELIVTQQNFATTSTEALAQEGKAVRLIWKRQHEPSVADGGKWEENEG